MAAAVLYTVNVHHHHCKLVDPPRSSFPDTGHAFVCGCWRGSFVRKNKAAERWCRHCRKGVLLSCSAILGDQSSFREENYWDQPEGKRKLREIEEMNELLSETRRLQSSEGPEDEADKAQMIREELMKRAKELAMRRKQAELMLQLGQRAYGKGMYDKAVELLEAALTNIQGASNLGGEVQIWLAMAYEANNKHKECIALYKLLESSHPNVSIRRQAKDLRFILEAPKLKISKDEMVRIPLLGENNSESRTWTKMYRERKKKMMKGPSTRDYMEDWLVWKPPRWERSPYFWVAVTAWLTLVGVSLMFQD